MPQPVLLELTFSEQTQPHPAPLDRLPPNISTRILSDHANLPLELPLPTRQTQRLRKPVQWFIAAIAIPSSQALVSAREQPSLSSPAHMPLPWPFPAHRPYRLRTAQYCRISVAWPRALVSLSRSSLPSHDMCNQSYDPFVLVAGLR